MISRTNDTPDIAIVGGGPSGLALAGMLERAGLDYIVFERGTPGETPRGGCLDLHVGSGQRACREAGCFDEMRKYGRLGDATVAWVWDHRGNKISSWGEGRDAPELDRHQIKKALLSTIPEEKIRWSKKLVEAGRDEEGEVVLRFEDGTSASGFKLVVGADGAHSKIRGLVTETKPLYNGRTFFTGTIHQDNPFYATVRKMAGDGPQVILGRGTKIWNQMQGDGHYRVEFGFERPLEYCTNLDLDTAAMKKVLLLDEFFGHHAESLKELISAVEGPFYPWPMWYMPVDRLNWAPSPGVTLIGDAAHLTPPFVGDGVNCAMRDSIILCQKLKEFGITTQAIAAYEKDMFPYAIDVIERSLEAGDLFFDDNAPTTFFEGMARKPLIGTTDEY